MSDCRGDVRKCADYMKRAIQTAELVVFYLLNVVIQFANNALTVLHFITCYGHWSLMLAQWQERRSSQVNFPHGTLDVQLMFDHLCE